MLILKLGSVSKLMSTQFRFAARTLNSNHSNLHAVMINVTNISIMTNIINSNVLKIETFKFIWITSNVFIIAQPSN